MINKQLDDMIQSIQAGYNPTFEINKFGEPRIQSDLETIKNILLFIILSKPGQYPSLPNLGYDIESKLYAFYDEIDENGIIEDICAQCEALRTYFNNGCIAIKKYKYKNQPSLIISVSGTESFPTGYMNDSRDNTTRYMIGISYDELRNMVYDVSEQHAN